MEEKLKQQQTQSIPTGVAGWRFFVLIVSWVVTAQGAVFVNSPVSDYLHLALVFLGSVMLFPAFRQGGWCYAGRYLLFFLLITSASRYRAHSCLPAPDAVQYVANTFLTAFKANKRRSKSARIHLEGYVDEEPSRPRLGEIRFPLRVTIRGGISFRALLSAPDVPWSQLFSARKGDRLSLICKCRPIQTSSDILPDPFSYAGYLVRRGMLIQGEVKSVEWVKNNDWPRSRRDRFIVKLFDKFGNRDSLAVLLAMVLAEQDLVGTVPEQLFRETGTSHILVVSGFHIGVVFLVFYFIAKRIISRLDKLLLVIPVQLGASILALSGACFYTVLVGGVLTTIRALFVLAVYAIGYMLGRKGDGFTSLLLALLTVVTVWPGSFYEVSFQLTFSAVCGLFVANQCTKAIFKGRQRGILKIVYILCSTLLYNIGAWLFTAPVLLLWFRSFYLLSPLVNSVMTPILSAIGICMGGISLACYYLMLPGSSLLLEANLVLIDWSLRVLDFFRNANDGTILNYHVFGRQAALSAALNIYLFLGSMLIVCRLFWLARKSAQQKQETAR